MDLKDLTPKSNTVTVNLVHPYSYEPLFNPDGSPMTIEVYSSYSKEYREALHEQTNRRLKQAQSKRKVDITAQDLEDQAINLYATVTKGWNITFDGVSPEFSHKKAAEIYTEVFWVRGQIDEAVADSLDFTKD